MQTQRLGEVSEDSESVSKKLNLLYDELESYKDQCKSLKQEMEEQERSLKAQNAALEKKQHESWVTVRQETRKLTDAQNEMQTLRRPLSRKWDWDEKRVSVSLRIEPIAMSSYKSALSCTLYAHRSATCQLHII